VVNEIFHAGAGAPAEVAARVRVDLLSHVRLEREGRYLDCFHPRETEQVGCAQPLRRRREWWAEANVDGELK
jgi:hypothetical protein